MYLKHIYQAASRPTTHVKSLLQGLKKMRAACSLAATVLQQAGALVQVTTWLQSSLQCLRYYPLSAAAPA